MTPKAPRSAGSGAWASSPTVEIPSDRMRVASLGPTPHIWETSRGQKTSQNEASSSPVSPRGFRTPAAILAISLFGPAPIEAPSPNRSRTSDWMREATPSASSRARTPAPRSRNASSTLKGSTSGVNRV